MQRIYLMNIQVFSSAIFVNPINVENSSFRRKNFFLKLEICRKGMQQKEKLPPPTTRGKHPNENFWKNLEICISGSLTSGEYFFSGPLHSFRPSRCSAQETWWCCSPFRFFSTQRGVSAATFTLKIKNIQRWRETPNGPRKFHHTHTLSTWTFVIFPIRFSPSLSTLIYYDVTTRALFS